MVFTCREIWACPVDSPLNQSNEPELQLRKTERSLTIVGQDIQRYKDVQSDIQQEDPKVPAIYRTKMAKISAIQMMTMGLDGIWG